MNWWQRLFNKQRQEEELDRELSFHLEQQVRRDLESGMSEKEARRKARLEFGGLDGVKEECRDARGTRLVENTIHDLRFAGRMLRRSPSFTIVAVLSLALGIGASTAVFSVVDALLFKRLPVPNPEQLVAFTKTDPDPNSKAESNSVTYRELERLRERSHSFSEMLGYVDDGEAQMKLPGGTAAPSGERVQAARVTSNFFKALGVEVSLGRSFTAMDDRTGEPEPVVILSHDFWRRRFGQDPQVLGRQIIVVRDVPFTIIGVAPPGFFGVETDRRPDMWWPLGNLKRTPNLSISDAGIVMMARLRPGVSLAQARAETAVIYRGMLEEMTSPDWHDGRTRWFLGQTLELQSGATGEAAGLRERFTKPLLVLMVSVAAVLLIAAVNVAALMLARGATRQKELVVRLALGSGRSRLIRQLLTEGVLLAALAGIAGLAIAHIGIQVLLSYAPAGAAAALNPGLDIRVLVFTLLTAISSVLIFGLAPAILTTKLNLGPTLKDGSFSLSGTRPVLRMNRFLVAAQIALSMLLLVGAGLFLRTLQNLRQLDPGFDSHNTTVFSINNGAVRASAAREIAPQIEAIPGVQSATYFVNIGLLGGNSVQSECAIDGYDPRANDQMGCVLMSVGPRFFETTGTPLILGREFGPEDARANPKVAIISESMAKHYFDDRNPLGLRVRGMEIIGVAGDAKYSNLREQSRRTFYEPMWAGLLLPDVRFAIRSNTAIAGLPSALRTIAQQVNPTYQVTNFQTIAEMAEKTLFRERLLVQFAGFFSMLALLLVCIGLYGALSYSVSRRTNEIGIRMALGARVGDVARLVLREAMVSVGIGVAVGLFSTALLTRYAAGLLFGLTPTDPQTIAAAALMMAAAGLLAAYLPARRASRVDPVDALRQQ